MQAQLKKLNKIFKGELSFDNSANHHAQLLAYSTDASVYQEKPLAVAVPKTESDLCILVKFALEHKLTLIPRAAGTSLTGQVVARKHQIKDGVGMESIASGRNFIGCCFIEVKL